MAATSVEVTYIDRELATSVRSALTLDDATHLIATFRQHLLDHDRRQSRAIAEGYKLEIERLKTLLPNPSP